jgi:hypothetical protein
MREYAGMAKKKVDPLAAAVEAQRKPPKVTLTLRLDVDDVDALQRLIKRTGARGAGEVVRILIRRADTGAD